jgi:hypothetical protein
MLIKYKIIVIVNGVSDGISGDDSDLDDDDYTQLVTHRTQVATVTVSV